MHPQPLRITLPLKTLASTTLSSYTPIHNIFGVKKKNKKLCLKAIREFGSFEHQLPILLVCYLKMHTVLS